MPFAAARVATAQTASADEWTWIGGSNTVPNCTTGECGAPGVYGTLGTPAAGNIPGSRTQSSTWTDSSDHLWLFGGGGYDANDSSGDLNDLWEFNPSTNQWAWMGGSSTVPSGGSGHSGVYGTLGTPAAGNIPGGRNGSVSWTDSTGHFWLFGGIGHGASGTTAGDVVSLNDLWEFIPSTNQWAWMGGSSAGNQPGVYGTLGTAAAGNIPGSRYGAISLTDSSGHLWLFGGAGYDANGTQGYLNDLWEFDPSTNQWAWMGGTTVSTASHSGVYGSLGTPAAGNIPGGRYYTGANWTDSGGHLWLFGGYGWDANGTLGALNDLWEFNPSTNQWAWMGGSSTVSTASQFGVYGTLGTPAAGNIPGSREYGASWTDSIGHLWLFGGGGHGASGNSGDLNDLWEFNPSTNQWAWMAGSSVVPSSCAANNVVCGQSGVYGTLGTAAAGNIPGGRYTAMSWIDGSGHLWLFGGYGYGYGANGTAGFLNDLWEYQPPTTTPTVTVTPSLTSVTTVQGLTVTVGVSAGSGSRTATGSVVVTGGGFTSSSVTLSGGSATFNIPAGSLAVGSNTFTASYTPDSSSSATYNSATGTSSAVTVTATPVTLSPGSLSFASQTVGSSSSVQTVTLTNTGGSALSVTTISASGDFADSQNCGGSVAAGASCTISVTFTPSTAGTRTGVLTIVDNATGSPQTVPLSGTGTVATPGIMLSPSALTFASATEGTTSPAQIITVSNLGSAALAVTSIVASGDFAETSTCGTSLAAGANCMISVTFTPTAAGPRTGVLTITDNASGSPQTVALTGGGEAVGISSTSTGLTIATAGGSATAPIQLSALDGFSGTVNLTCAVTYQGQGTPNDAPACSLSPQQAQVSGNSPASSTLTVSTTAATASGAAPELGWKTTGTMLATLIFFGILPRRRLRGGRLLVLLCLATLVGIAGCSGGTSSGGSSTQPANSGTTTGSYQVMVTATSGTAITSTTIPLSLQ